MTLFRRQEHELPALAPGSVILLRGLVVSPLVQAAAYFRLHPCRSANTMANQKGRRFRTASIHGHGSTTSASYTMPTKPTWAERHCSRPSCRG